MGLTEFIQPTYTCCQVIGPIFTTVLGLVPLVCTGIDFFTPDKSVFLWILKVNLSRDSLWSLFLFSWCCCRLDNAPSPVGSSRVKKISNCDFVFRHWFQFLFFLCRSPQVVCACVLLQPMCFFCWATSSGRSIYDGRKGGSSCTRAMHTIGHFPPETLVLCWHWIAASCTSDLEPWGVSGLSLSI